MSIKMKIISLSRAGSSSTETGVSILEVSSESKRLLRSSLDLGEDTQGNELNLWGGSAWDYLERVGIDPSELSFKVVGGFYTAEENSPPTITTLGVSAGASTNVYTITIDGEDNETGWGALGLTYRHDETGEQLVASSNRYYGNSLDNASISVERTWYGAPDQSEINATFNLNGYGNTIGTYSLVSADFYDVSGNHVVLSGHRLAEQISDLGLDETQLKINIADNTTGASNGIPSLQNLSIGTPSVDRTDSSVRQSVSLDITQSKILNYSKLALGQNSILFWSRWFKGSPPTSNDAPFRGDETTLTGTFSIPPSTDNGVYEIKAYTFKLMESFRHLVSKKHGKRFGPLEWIPIR